MQRQRRHDTLPELELRRAIRAQGLGYRVHVRPVRSASREADIVFVRARVAVFVDGCFWHACPQHATWPRSNAEFWRRKIESNRDRDRGTDALLTEEGWVVVRVWEHEDATVAAERILALVLTRRSGGLARTLDPAADMDVLLVVRRR